MTKAVLFEPVDDALNPGIDEAYRTKYRGSSYLNSMLIPRACAATVRIIPRSTA
jgi:hypothetical protein